MARLAELTWGRLTALLTKLGTAGLTVELAEKLSQSPDLVRRVVEMVKNEPQPPAWSSVRSIRLSTDEWQEVAPSIRAKVLAGNGITVTYQTRSSAGWSLRSSVVPSSKWWEFMPGVQLRQSPTDPGLTEFRHKA